MKTILKVTLVSIFALVASSSFAAGNLKLNVLPIGGQRALVNISTVETSDLKISLTDDDGNVVYYQESDANENFRQVFNFSELDKGNYIFRVVCDEYTTETQIEKSEGSVRFGKEMTTIHPRFTVDDNILRCAYLNFNNEHVVFHLYQSDEELLNKPIGNDFNVQQAVNISKLGRGDYEAVLTAGDKQFTFNIKIK